MAKKSKPPKASPYTILNRWLHDGSKTTSVPAELKDDKVIPNTILLYYFQASKYILYMSEVFNNYNIYQLNKVDVLKFLKQSVLLSGYKPPFIERVKQDKKKIAKVLRLKFPYFKEYEIYHLIDIIDNSDEKDRVYETLGFRAPKKKKTTKAYQQKLEKMKEETSSKVTLNSFMENFA